MNPKVVFLVGHENWGKSETLYYLAGASHHKGWIVINDLDVFVRHMSNDDLPESFFEFIETVGADNKPYIIAALCPNFVKTEAQTDKVLKNLTKKGYDLFFWVMRYQYGTSNVITSEEINRLRQYGDVKVYSDISEAAQRAISFKLYLSEIFHN